MGAAEANTAAQAPPSTTPENVEALLEAARYGDMDDVVSLASSGVPLDSKDDQRRTVKRTDVGFFGCYNKRIAGEDFRSILVSVLSQLHPLHLFLADCTCFALSALFFALHMAAANGHTDIVEYLISSRVDLHAPNEEKNTPLHWACLNGHVEVVKKLIMAGANVSFLNSHERTPMDEAVSRGKLEVMDAINEAVALVELRSAMVST